MTAPTSGMRRITGATHSGASTSSAAPEAFSRVSSGCAMSASPIQLGATTRMRCKKINDLLWGVLYTRTWFRSTGRASRLPSPRRGTRADAATRAACPGSGSAAGDPSRLLRLDGRQPRAALPVFSGHDVEERFLDRLRHRPGLALADHPAVELTDRRHFGRGAGEERLVGDIDVVAGQPLFAYLISKLGGQLDHGRAGDSGEGGSEFRLENLSVFHDENILARAFGNEAVHVEQEAFVVAVHRGLERREHRVRVGARHLGARHGDVDVMARIGRGFH